MSSRSFSRLAVTCREMLPLLQMNGIRKESSNVLHTVG